jgi:ketosteroid isomerase-like protein
MSAESVVRRYLETVFGAGTRDELEALLHPELRFVEHPNLVNPRGTERDRQTMLETFDRGRALLARQSFAIDQLSVRGGEVVVRGTWTGTVAAAAGGLPAGAELRAHIAMFVEVEDGLVRRQTNYDCYEPLPVA